MSSSDRLPESSASDPTASRSPLAAVDRLMASSPWFPRAVPYFLYLLFLPAIWYFGRLVPGLFIPCYVLQCGLVGWLLWRYRKLVPELNLKFHWLAVPTSLGLCAAWVGLGLGMEHLAPGWFKEVDKGHILKSMGLGSPLFIASVGLEYVGMSLVVPLFEELLMRSALLRGTSSAKQTGVGVLQLLVDFPLIGDWLIETKLGQWATAQPPAFTTMLESTPVGHITVFSILASSIVFALGHAMRDWPAAILCGVVWCVVLWYTNRGDRKRGLGPIVWSHGLTNAWLLTYVLVSHPHPWQFL